MFEILVLLGYLKPVSQVTSSYIAEQNIKLFEKMCRGFTSQKVNDEPFYNVEDLRRFLLAIN